MADEQQRGLIDSAITAYLGTLLQTPRFRAMLDKALDKLTNMVHTMDRDRLATFLCDEVKTLTGIASAPRPVMHAMISEADNGGAGSHRIYCGKVRHRLTKEVERKKRISHTDAAALVNQHVTDEDILSASEHHGVARSAVVDSAFWDWFKANWSTILQVALSLLGLVLMFADEEHGNA